MFKLPLKIGALALCTLVAGVASAQGSGTTFDEPMVANGARFGRSEERRVGKEC